ncbi:hypothetical protein OCH239_20180 [Roseivivax halodurans JCM 10272]|uniref:Uncharacterized protein n=1 Tax=Roseivivax halodurans JCM 10272 TaxID=1449350 RepID=X7E5W1_9RHOB|nr:hypothetical protein OCH239_20180 [Roseivivax halodurans JCM 10272]
MAAAGFAAKPRISDAGISCLERLALGAVTNQVQL